MKTIIEIQDFNVLQEVIDKYDLDSFANITSVIVQLIDECARRDYADVEIRLHKSVAPDAYISFPHTWGQIIKPQIKYPFFKCFKRYRSDWIIIRCSAQSEIIPIFKQYLIREANETETNKLIKIPRHKIPQSYQDQPHVILSRIKKETGIYLKLKARTRTEFIYAKLQP